MDYLSGVLTISDRSAKGERLDATGPLICDLLKKNNFIVKVYAIVADEVSEIVDTLLMWSDSQNVNLIITTGGTGFSPRDVTPEATLQIIDKNAPGISEAIRNYSLQKTPYGMLSRGISGIRGKTLILNLPGSPTGAIEGLELVIPVLQHALSLLVSFPGSNEDHHFPQKDNK